MYVLDTNIVIAFLKGDASVGRPITDWQRTRTPLITSTVTLTELLAFARLTRDEEERIKLFLSTVTRPVSVSWRIAELAGHIRQRYGLKIADSLIAATAWHEASVLVTRNVADFRKVKELRIESL